MCADEHTHTLFEIEFKGTNQQASPPRNVMLIPINLLSAFSQMLHHRCVCVCACVCTSAYVRAYDYNSVVWEMSSEDPFSQHA